MVAWEARNNEGPATRITKQQEQTFRGGMYIYYLGCSMWLHIYKHILRLTLLYTLNVWFSVGQLYTSVKLPF